MTIEQAIEKLFESTEFKVAAKQTAYFRNQLSRYNKGALKKGAMVDLLLKFGYTINVTKNRASK